MLSCYDLIINALNRNHIALQIVGSRKKKRKNSYPLPFVKAVSYTHLGGSVQNIKFTPRMFREDREKIKMLFQTYFDKGGCQLMVTVVDHGILEDAQKHPEKYPDLIVRVAGYSAVFVNLTKDIQDLSLIHIFMIIVWYL